MISSSDIDSEEDAGIPRQVYYAGWEDMLKVSKNTLEFFDSM